MLVLAKKVDQTICIGANIRVTIVRVAKGKVKMAI